MADLVKVSVFEAPACARLLGVQWRALPLSAGEQCARQLADCDKTKYGAE